jgi:hypothetical protein
MRQPLRVAILECDEPVGETKKKYGSFGNLFKELLVAGALSVGERGFHERPELIFSRYNVLNDMAYPKLESVDAVLLSGSSKWVCSISSKERWLS